MTGVTLLRISARLAALIVGPGLRGHDPCHRPVGDGRTVLRHQGRLCPRHQRRAWPWTPGQAFADALSALIGGRSLTTYAVNYPASFDFLAAADGAADATNYISSLAGQCPCDPDRARGILAGCGGRRHARRHPAARQQNRRDRVGTAVAGRALSPTLPRWRCSETPQRSSVIRSRRPFSAARPSTCARTATRSAPAAGTRSPTAIT